MSGRLYDGMVIIWAAENNGESPNPKSNTPHVGFVEFSVSAHLSLAIRLFFRYCVFAKNRNGGNDYDEPTSGQAVPTLRQ